MKTVKNGKNEFLLPPNAKVIIPGKLWVKICGVAAHMGTTPDLWIEQRLRGQLSRFASQKWFKKI